MNSAPKDDVSEMTVGESTSTISVQSLIQQIERAFAKVRLEDGVSMSQARAIDDWKSREEERAARKKDREKTWMDIPDTKIEDYCDVLGFVDAKGFRFYLPAFMRWTLRHPEARSYTLEAAVLALDAAKQTKGKLEFDFRYEERLAILSKQQCDAIRAFLGFLVVLDRDQWEPRVRSSLEYCWVK